MRQDIKKLIEENLKSKNPELDLSFLEITGKESELLLLKTTSHLQSLDLSHNHLEDIAFLSDLSSLHSLDLSHNNRIEDISFLKNLNNLQYLDLENNSIQDISSIKALKSLQYLDLSYNKIQNISSIKALKNLQYLIVKNNRVQDTSPIEYLKKLQNLDLSINRILDIKLENFQDLEDINLKFNTLNSISFKILPKIKNLDLASLRLKKIELKDLKSLESLDLKENHLQNITLDNFQILANIDISFNPLQSISLKNLPKVKELDLSSLKLKKVELEQLENLQNLDLGNNQVQDISSVKILEKLQKLNLKHNQIQGFSLDFLNHFPKLLYLNLYQNPIQNLPKEVFNASKNVLEDVGNYLEALQENSYLQEGKMILIGNGEVGKTSIRLRLLDKNAILPKKEERTQGIDWAMETYQVQSISTEVTGLSQNINFDFHIWDFGGQGRYREVQQLFCSHKSLYLFVTSPDDASTKEDYVNFEYWLSMANAFNYDKDSQKHSPVIHVLNKIDQENIVEINPKERKSLFPNIESFVQISAKALKNFQNLEESIKTVLPYVSKDIFTTPFPKSWLNIKAVLEDKTKKGETHILYQDYLKLCEENKVNISSADTLLYTLDRMGYIIYYGNHQSLHEWIILNPLWIKNVIYKVLDSDLIKDAKLYPSQFKDIWKDYKTQLPDKDNYQKFLALMLAYEFCYAEKTTKGEVYYVIPALFGDKPNLPKDLQSFDYEVKFEYKTFIPAGTVNKLIVRLHEKIYNKEYHWKNGVIFHLEGNYVEVQEVWQEKAVYLKLKGEDVKEVYDLIYRTLLSLNQELENTKFLAKLEVDIFIKYENEWRTLKDMIDFKIRDYNFVLQNSPYEKEQAETTTQTQKLLDLIDEFKLAEVFKTLEDLKIKNKKLTNLKHEFMSENYQAKFSERLKVFVETLNLD